MEELTLFYSLILPLCFGSEVTIVKTIGRGPDVTEICVKTPLSNIILIVCKIRTERNAECLLLFEPIEGFMQPCDSRFSLKTENQTVFLHLMNLTAEDSGNHTCECSHPEGTDILHLNITVEDVLEDVDGSILTQIPIPGEDIKVSVQSQPHLDHLHVKIPAIWMEMTLMTLMTPTQPSNSQTVISTRVSLIQPAERRVLWRTRRDTAETDASCKLYANM
ncbi:Glycosyltransferase-like [Dissostichus eleginoides]|uniref:Glycosyltransferase-like n=1 Tax=Dissostichus eleginoides TaxID=100907 RepID=A0AAD9EPB3_DISEL|nr:Glycosyltransferase-like [Dissostichus eleginoides]